MKSTVKYVEVAVHDEKRMHDSDISFAYYQSRMKWYYFLPENLRWSGDNKHPTRPHTILKNKKARNGERSSVFVFFSMVCGRVG